MLHTSSAEYETTRLRCWSRSAILIPLREVRREGGRSVGCLSRPALARASARDFGASPSERRGGSLHRTGRTKTAIIPGSPALAHDVPLTVMPSRRQVAHRRRMPGRSSRVQTAPPNDRIPQRRLGLLVERTAWTFGSVCLVTFGALSIDGARGARHELERFALLQAAGAPADPRTGPEPLGPGTHHRLAAGTERTRTATARGPAHPEDWPRGCGPAEHRRLHAQSRRGSHRRHGTAGDGWQLRNRRASRRVLSGLERHRTRRCHRARNASRERSLSRRTDMGRQSGGRICARSYAGALTDAGHMLSVLPRRPGAAALHRPRRTCRYHRRSALAVEQVSGASG